MANKRLWAGISVMALVFTVTVISCNKVDKSINGSWVSNGFEFKFKDGKFEVLVDEVSFQKGTYTTKDGEIAFVPTHIFGGGFNTLLELSEEDSGFESKWYSIKDFIVALKAVMIKLGLSESEADKFDDDFVNSLSPANKLSTYNLSGNTLNLTTDGATINFTKK